MVLKMAMKLMIYSTDATNNDSDNDGISDGEELFNMEQIQTVRQ